MPKTKEPEKKKSVRAQQLTAIVAAVLVLAAALMVFVFRDEIGKMLGAGGGDPEMGEAWTFEAGSAQVFACAGNGLATASSTGLQLLDADGNTVVHQVCSLETPALAASGKLATAYDIGGTTLYVADFDGNVTEIDTVDTIISVTMNDNGFMAVTTSAVGYKGLVKVYDAQLEQVYEWYSGEGYPLSARVSPDNKSLAVLTAAEDGGQIHVFSLSSADEQGSFLAANELLIDMDWMDSGRICAVSEKRAVFIEDTGETVGAYDFGGMYITDYSFDGSGFLALVLSKYLSGNASVIVTVGANGEPLGQMEPDSELRSLSASDRQVLMLFSDTLSLYSQSLKSHDDTDEVQGVKKALVRENGDVILIFTASAQIKSL